ncbi:GINS complex, Sld5 component [Piedraia hortae CBS 480.64]|uniref:DNA replication complex GINS protein SLD5 n=1 Tax=Piedraia hortae CBS 480.64 TaxID=1314780 RepID=A0A6A7BUE6_9PEZI|nr:GINS complex, Sld5 component [Piedraia hortae CBS 480.64]
MEDIQDILDQVSTPVRPHNDLDLQEMVRAWVHERCSPDLLPYPSELIDRVMARMRQHAEMKADWHQVNALEEVAATDHFALVILQTDLERVKFLLRSFVRVRLQKIDRYPHYYRTRTSEDPALSSLEQQYLETHQALLSAHYNAAFLSSFPSALQRLDDTSGGISMVDAPESDSVVFCRVMRDAGRLRLHGESGPVRVELKRGDVWVLRWSSVVQLVKKGDVELI